MSKYYFDLWKVQEEGKPDFYFECSTNVPKDESGIKSKLERAAHTLLTQMEEPGKEVSRVRVEYNFGTKKIRRI